MKDLCTNVWGPVYVVMNCGKLICREWLEVRKVSGNVVVNFSEVVFVVWVKRGGEINNRDKNVCIGEDLGSQFKHFV